MKADARIRIPKSRIAVVIGPNGAVKRQLEKTTKISVDIDSNDGLVTLESMEDCEDPLALWKARDIIQAIGRGFSPQRAFALLDDDIYLRVINLEEFGSSPNQLRRLKGRVIGQGGKTRRNIEELTDTYVAIMGNTISVIGEVENQQIAVNAIVRLLRGAEHSTINRYLNTQRRNMKKRRTLELWHPLGPKDTEAS
ncbi:MAG: KH domain-containing protein [Promethearchaeota archaeon]